MFPTLNNNNDHFIFVYRLQQRYIHNFFSRKERVFDNKSKEQEEVDDRGRLDFDSTGEFLQGKELEENFVSFKQLDRPSVLQQVQKDPSWVEEGALEQRGGRGRAKTDKALREAME